MNPVGQPVDSVPLQGRYEDYPAQPGVTTTVQHTTVNISAKPPKDYVVWSICSFVHCNPCCLGLAALIYSIKARDRRMAGDLDGARSHASTARCLNIWAIVLVFLLIFFTFVVCSRTIWARPSYSYSYPSSQDNYPYYGGYK